MASLDQWSWDSSPRSSWRNDPKPLKINYWRDKHDRCRKDLKDFLILDQIVNDEPLVYLDNAATTQKPKSCLRGGESLLPWGITPMFTVGSYSSGTGNASYEAARVVRRFINASSTKEVLFTRGTTAWTGLSGLQSEILEEGMRSLSLLWNTIPTSFLTGSLMEDRGEVGLCLLERRWSDESTLRKLTDQTKFVSITHASNVLGVINPIQELA